MGEPIRLTVPPELDSARADRIVATLAKLTRSATRALLEEGAVRIDGAVPSGSQRVAAGSVVEVVLPASTPELEPAPVVFEVAHADADVIVIDKPSGLVVHPGSGHRSGTLVNGLLMRFPDLADLGSEHRWGLVHRLDQETSGLLVVARNAKTYSRLQAALKDRLVTRAYLALVEGRTATVAGTVEAPVGRDPAHPTRMAVTGGGREARTHYRRRTAWAAVSLLDVTLDTGRTHQIRVHMSSIGHPLVGDTTYGAHPGVVGDPGRVWLHARRLAFTHPNGRDMSFGAPLPFDLVASLEALGDPERGSVASLR